MPLKALLDGQPILAPLLGDTAWAELYFHRYRLVLPCCPDRAVQMRGGAGTRRIQHFSHAPAPTCQFRGETTAHLLAKVEIARACAEAGWAVDIEHAEADWRADILAERNGQRVAFEVQWSRQTLAETETRQARYRAAGVRGCWFFRYPPPELRHAGGAEAEARWEIPLFPLMKGPGRDAYRVQVGSRPHGLGEVVAALLGKRIAFRSHRTFLGDHTMEIAFYDKLCPSCGAPSRLYSIASSREDELRATCGSRVLLWSEALYHPDVAHAARRAYGTTLPWDEIRLVMVEPGVGFRCHRCRRRLAPFRAGHPSPGSVTVAACVTFTRPLCDPYPHWCFSAGGTFCAPSASTR